MDRKFLEISCNYKLCGNNILSNCSTITNDLNNNTNSNAKFDSIDSKEKPVPKHSMTIKRKSHPGVKESDHEMEDSTKRNDCNKSDEENSFEAPNCKKAKLSSEAIKHEIGEVKPLLNIDSNSNTI